MVVEAVIGLLRDLGLIAVAGSFLVAFVMYKRRQDDQREALKRAIFTELLSTSHIDRAYSVAIDDDEKDHIIDLDVDQDGGVPANQFLPTTIGRSYSEKFGLLESEETEAIVAYYSSAENLREVIKARRMYDMSLKNGHGNLVNQMSNIVAGEILEVKERRDKLLGMWCSEFGYSKHDLEKRDVYVNPEWFGTGKRVSRGESFWQTIHLGGLFG